MQKDIILKFINSLEDNYFYWHNESVRLKISSNQNEIDIIGKDCDDSDEVLDGFYIDDVEIKLLKDCIKINGDYFLYDC